MGDWKKPVDMYHIIYQRHAIERMAERGIREEDVERVLLVGEVIEDYPSDIPYPSILLLGWCGMRPIHLVVATDAVGRRKIVITVYVPDSNKWDADFKGRKR
jgi:uncharacterized protein DUF4258